jgi:hypothetical protein
MRFGGLELVTLQCAVYPRGQYLGIETLSTRRGSARSCERLTKQAINDRFTIRPAVHVLSLPSCRTIGLRFLALTGVLEHPFQVERSGIGSRQLETARHLKVVQTNLFPKLPFHFFANLAPRPCQVSRNRGFVLA